MRFSRWFGINIPRSGIAGVQQLQAVATRVREALHISEDESARKFDGLTLRGMPEPEKLAAVQDDDSETSATSNRILPRIYREP